MLWKAGKVEIPIKIHAVCPKVRNTTHQFLQMVCPRPSFCEKKNSRAFQQALLLRVEIARHISETRVKAIQDTQVLETYHGNLGSAIPPLSGAEPVLCSNTASK
jgi:hypothetical protein